MKLVDGDGTIIGELPSATDCVVVEEDGYAYALDAHGDSLAWWPEIAHATYRANVGVAWRSGPAYAPYEFVREGTAPEAWQLPHFPGSWGAT